MLLGMVRPMGREPVRFVDFFFFSKIEIGSGFESVGTELSVQI